MGRKPPCSSELKIKKAPWTSQEDKILMEYVRIHGEGKWRDLAQKAGLKRCGKSCRLRWLNYLRPGIKLGNISQDEEELIIKLHRLLGNRWTLIAGRLPGRSGNEIKNYWHTTLSKKVLAKKNKHIKLEAQLEEKNSDHHPQPVATSTTSTSMQPNGPPGNNSNPVTKSASVVNPPEQPQDIDQVQIYNNEPSFWEYIASASSSSVVENDDLMGLWMDSVISQLFSDALDMNAQYEEPNSKAEVAVEDYGFSFDIFSNEP